MGKWTRRAFLSVGGLLGGGLVIGVGGVAFAPNRFGVREASGAGGDAQLTTWLKIAPDGTVEAIVPHCEMGQGAQVGLAMMLTEELGARWDQVRIKEAPAEEIYANGHFITGFLGEAGSVPSWLQRSLEYTTYRISRLIPLQVTGGSASIRATGQYGMQVAGAAARSMLQDAAAAEWGVAAHTCDVADGVISHPGGKSAGIGQFASAAASLEPPIHPQLRDRSDYKLVGTSPQRPDFPGKVTGEATYGVDVTLPDMLVATVAASPAPGGVLESVAREPALAVKGVREVLALPEAVAVVADSYYAASKGLKSLAPVFSNPHQAVSSESILAEHGSTLDAGGGGVDRKVGDGEGAIAAATEVVEAEYWVPYLAHATMEPMAATVQVRGDDVEVWAGVQDPLNARAVVASELDIDANQVTFHNMPLGGGFGRRLPFAFDYLQQAARIGKAMSPAPVKMIWSREEDMGHDFYRPAMLARYRGGIDATGHASAWTCGFTGSGDMGAGWPIYDVPHQEILTHSAPGPLRGGSWRSVGHSQHGFFMESFVDELAVAAGRDALAFRRDLLASKPRHQKVLDRVGEMSDWEGLDPSGRARGVAIVEGFGSICAEVAEVSVQAGQIRVHNVWVAVDCGLLVHPDQGTAQIEGGVIFGLSAALYQEITVEGGVPVQRSFPDYPMVKLADAPDVQVSFVDSDGPVGGLGEPGVPPVAPAVANAVFALTGERLRSLPMRPSV